MEQALTPPPGEQPRVSPSLLRDAAEMCPRRVALDFCGEKGSRDPLGRARLRDPFISAVRNAHTQPGIFNSYALSTPLDLEPEEQAVFAHAARWYEVLYADRCVTNYLHDCNYPTMRKGIRVGGWVDLTFINNDGLKEYRTFDLWGGRGPRHDPLEIPAVWLALLRLRPWLGQEESLVRVSWADLITGRKCERVVNMELETPQLVEQFDNALHQVEARANPDKTDSGIGCGQCRHLGHCPAHPGAITISSTYKDIKPGVLRITPTSFEMWMRCRRAWRNKNLFNIPTSNDEQSSDHGIMVHAVLRFIHENGSCANEAFVTEVIESHGASDRLRDEVLRHKKRCPTTAETFGHEVDLARYSAAKPVNQSFLAAARFDAIWIHDGVLDARDYKTGSKQTLRVADDPRAWIQAWILGTIAQSKGLKLQLRYEHLAAEIEDDPDLWELDEEEIRSVEDRIRAEIINMREENSWQGVSELSACRFCGYRAICPDSALSGEPTWLEVEPVRSEN